MLAILRSDLVARLGLGFLLGAVGLYAVQPADARANFHQAIESVYKAIT